VLRWVVRFPVKFILGNILMFPEEIVDGMSPTVGVAPLMYIDARVNFVDDISVVFAFDDFLE
tara:strand:- start:5520 stop:5705 length:186 start_codon:yes stop_codon:yes gene_type:complete